ncbi:MAG TPA: DUF3097 domain-containing protein [Mycobacteriales bacterium]|nr:DUF3097 domain-containing protein [Mycobacteriales bacterium]
MAGSELPLRSVQYGPDVIAASRFRRREAPVVDATLGVVVEERGTGFCGAVVEHDKHAVTLEDRHGRRRAFPWQPAGFLLDGAPVSLRPAPLQPPSRTPARTASGSVPVPGLRARVARASRLLVEGAHDAALIERVWGDDLRVEGVVVEQLDGIDALPEVLRTHRPGPDRRLGVLVDHLVPGSKESRVVGDVKQPHVLVLGHPYVDVWQAVKPAAVGIPAWPSVPKGIDWKVGVCSALGERGGPPAMWRRVLAAVHDYADLEVPLLRAVEELIDFVTAPGA